MAVWQFQLEAIPAASTRVDDVDAIHLGSEQKAKARVSLTPAEFEALSTRLSAVLPEKKGWHGDLRIWGDEESDDVQVWFDGGDVESVTIRLDARHFRPSLVSGLCAIARDFEWLLLGPQGMVLRPTPEAVVRAALRSPAQRFVNDPDKFLEEIERSEEQPD